MGFPVDMGNIVGPWPILAKLNREDIPEEGLEVELVEDEAGLKEFFLHIPRVDFAIDRTLKANLMVNKSGNTVFIQGRIQTALLLQCSRCLEGFRFPLDSYCEVTLFPFEDEVLSEEEELNLDDLSSGYYYGGEIDFSAIIREQLLLDIPYKPLCSPSCKGLCPTCGNDLNRGSCSCKDEVFDDRFAPLKGLRIGRGQRGD